MTELEEAAAGLELALAQLSKIARTRIRKTLLGDRPIVAHIWLHEIDGVNCGCLLMDGYVDAWHKAIQKPDAPDAGEKIPWLMAKYRMKRNETNDERMNDVIMYYDRLAKNNQYAEMAPNDFQVRVLNLTGRHVILAMLDRIDG